MATALLEPRTRAANPPIASSRRAALAALAAAPVIASSALAAIPGGASGDGIMNMHTRIARPLVGPAPSSAIASAWSIKSAEFLRAKEAEELFDAKVWTPAYRRERAADLQSATGRATENDRIPESHNDEIERLTDARCDAEDALISTAAPDLAAVIWKITYARKRWEDFEGWPDEWWDGVMSDLHRLGGLA